jgi:hypothetical protein
VLRLWEPIEEGYSHLWLGQYNKVSHPLSSGKPLKSADFGDNLCFWRQLRLDSSSRGHFRTGRLGKVARTVIEFQVLFA